MIGAAMAVFVSPRRSPYSRGLDKSHGRRDDDNVRGTRVSLSLSHSPFPSCLCYLQIIMRLAVADGLHVERRRKKMMSCRVVVRVLFLNRTIATAFLSRQFYPLARYVWLFSLRVVKGKRWGWRVVLAGVMSTRSTTVVRSCFRKSPHCRT